MDIWDYVGGIIRIIIGFCIALLVGTAFFIALNFSSEMNELGPQNTDYSLLFTAFTVLFAAPITALVFGKFAIFPMLLIVGWSEVTGKKDATFYMLAGVVMGVLLIGYGASKDLPFTADLYQCLIVVCSCIVGMLAYWLVAGKLAGRFKS